MISENQVELVIKCNLRSKSHQHKQFWWNPSLTSTPIRKPLHPLTNLEVVSDNKQYNYLSSHINRYIVPSKVNKLEDNEETTKNSFEKDKNEDFYNVLSSDEDESDIKKNKLPKKNLVIKLGNCRNKTFKNKVNKKNEVEKNCISFPEGKLEPEIIENSSKNAVEDNFKHLKTLTLHASKGVNNLEKKNDPKITDNGMQEISTNYVFVNKNNVNGKIAEEPADIQNNGDKELNTKSDKILSKKRKDVLSKDVFVKKFKTVEENLDGCSNINKSKMKKISNKMTSSKNLKNGSDLKKTLHIENVTQDENPSDKLPISHEIFSDSKEQELRDSLNLTNSDSEESCRIDNNQNSNSKTQKMQKLSLKCKNLSSKKNKNSDTINILDSSSEVVQQKRTIKSPREFWLPRSERFDSSSSKEHVLGNEDDLIPRQEELVKISSSMHSSSPKKKINKILQSKRNQGNKILQNSFIKDISEMKFIKKVKGGNHEFLAAIGCELSSFKCCVLKITKNSKIIGKTKEKNSHCGGVILKGKLLMKIQDDEVEVKQGRIFHVPPLTDWKMFNNGRTECIVYCWRGRF